MPCMLIGYAAMTNVRRIQHYLEAIREQDKPQKVAKSKLKCSQQLQGVSCFVLARAIFTDLINPIRSPKQCLVC